MNTKNNQRYRDMDKKLKSTLLELLKTTGFEKVTVKKLCETACVNRTTFYAHYADIYEMMGQMEEHLNQDRPIEPVSASNGGRELSPAATATAAPQQAKEAYCSPPLHTAECVDHSTEKITVGSVI